MKNVITKRSRLSTLILMVLVAAMLLSLAACGGKPDETNANTPGTEGTTKVGEGSKVFTFEVVDADGVTTVFEVSTDAENVGDALLENQLIEGDEGPYGLYVKTVNGLTVDYDKDGKYWAFYVNGEYAMASADLTEIEEGATYCFKVE